MPESIESSFNIEYSAYLKAKIVPILYTGGVGIFRTFGDPRNLASKAKILTEVIRAKTRVPALKVVNQGKVFMRTPYVHQKLVRA
ncbi:hypothetical protein S7335_377 [Synechococcus sp. PCC 7335]|nr:hypothetical protein S7335_377 [Synechococcus sp. PCC 7335]